MHIVYLPVIKHNGTVALQATRAYPSFAHFGAFVAPRPPPDSDDNDDADDDDAAASDASLACLAATCLLHCFL